MTDSEATGVTDESADTSTDGIEHFVSSETDEWATPPSFVRPLADAIGGFDLDPCSGAEKSPVADETYTEADDGLHQPWFGDVWLNPPYSDMERWLSKTVEETRSADVNSVLALIKGDTSTQWYHRFALEAEAIAFVEGRLAFGDGENSAPFASHVLVYGDVPDAVFDTLDHHGSVVRNEIISRTEQGTLCSVQPGTDRPEVSDE